MGSAAWVCWSECKGQRTVEDHAQWEAPTETELRNVLVRGALGVTEGR